MTRGGRAFPEPHAVLVDSHCHIAGPEFADDLDEVIERAQVAGLAYALVILAADDEPELTQARVVSGRWPGVRFSIGVHPHAAAKFSADHDAAIRQVEAALDAQPLARGLGEIGLDYHYDFAPRDVQQSVFAAPDPPGTAARTSDRDSHARSRRRYVSHSPRRGRGRYRRFSLFHRGSDGGATSARHRFLHLARRHRDVSAGNRAEGGGEDGAARSAAHRDRQPLSGTGSSSRKTQRAGPCGTGGRDDRAAARSEPRVDR